MDDGEGYGFEKGEYLARRFEWDGKVLKSEKSGSQGYVSGAKVVKVRVLGEEVKEVKQDLSLDEDWSIEI